MVETPLPYYGRKEVVHALYISHNFSQPQQTTLLLRLERGFSKTKVECIISMKDEGILMENKDTELILKAIGQINNQLEGINGRLDGVDNRLNGMDKKIDDLREDMEIEFAAVHREINNVYQLAKRNHEDIEKLSQIQGSARMDKMEARITILEEKYRELKQA
jgi:archaellum component FlaC